MTGTNPLLQALKATSGAVERVLDPMLAVPDGPEARVVDAMRYAIFSPGKRLRPFLVLASSELFDVNRQQALRVAAAIECVHTYSLIHDDLPAMDDDDVRRGRPTVHKAFDDATAILAGDALLTLAFDILVDEKTHKDKGVRLELVRTLAQASGHHGMVGGQMIDITAGDHELDEAAIYRLQQMKTGALISASAEAGAILGRAEKRERHSLQGYARDLGLAFQIADDLLDVEGDPMIMGKAAQKDGRQGKATLVALMGAGRARQQAHMLAEQAIEHLSLFDERASLLRAVAQFVISRRA
ncbi:polyprenyl synthetase family protein [Eilatimonas milleporae]|uniref:Farnesyl-diphosphate synthase n=1 Tax=Eilatimonas milleporae TaxID=911205 RepID=A0A3M0CND9_9PROT|nr:farnesyl diphosphate synthase [Eilatimonas milleporae]RMB08399.1 farnesyl-diphosphate synthase [Eilatimonas milleporae]